MTVRLRPSDARISSIATPMHGLCPGEVKIFPVVAAACQGQGRRRRRRRGRRQDPTFRGVGVFEVKARMSSRVGRCGGSGVPYPTTVLQDAALAPWLWVGRMLEQNQFDPQTTCGRDSSGSTLGSGQ